MNTILIDIIIICLLAATISYALILNRRIKTIHQNRDEVQELLEYFSTTLKRAEVSIDKLKSSAHEIIHSLKTNLKEAQKTRDDLQFLVERGEQIADQLEEGIREKRKMTVSQYAQHIETKEKTVNYEESERIDEEEDLPEIKQGLMGRLKNLK